jgi:hypothetical protein
MNKITLSMLAALAMSTTAYAAGDKVVSPYYIGLGYSYFDASSGSTDITADGMLGIAGYTIDDNFSIEGRFTGTSGDLSWGGVDRNKSITNAAIYVKAKYRWEGFAAYGLLGIGQTRANGNSDEAFQYGVGVNFDINDKFGLFADWTTLYDDSGLNYSGDTSDYTINTWNFGGTYNF